jgi:hypothetical protein
LSSPWRMTLSYRHRAGARLVSQPPVSPGSALPVMFQHVPIGELFQLA